MAARDGRGEGITPDIAGFRGQGVGRRLTTPLRLPASPAATSPTRLSRYRRRGRAAGAPELLQLIRDLYALRPENKEFIRARFLSTEETLQPYKTIIQESLYPDGTYDEPIQLDVHFVNPMPVYLSRAKI